MFRISLMLSFPFVCVLFQDICFAGLNKFILLNLVKGDYWFIVENVIVLAFFSRLESLLLFGTSNRKANHM